MKTLKILIFAVVAAFALSAAAFGQAPDKKEAPAFDAELAKRLGADKMGMRSYVLAILRTGPNDAKITDKAKRDELFKGHFGMITRLSDEGKLVMAGPFADEKRIYRGLYIFAVDSVEEAKKLTETDPSIKAGIFEAEFIKWYGSAAVMELGSIHKRIAQENP